MKKNLYFHIDAIKALLALAVVMNHTQPLISFPDLNYYICGGGCKVAVSVFFAFSGFFYAHKRRQPLHFIRRVIILYVLWNIIYLPITLRHCTFDGVADAMIHVLFTGTFAVSWYLVAMIWCAVVQWLCDRIDTWLALLPGLLLYVMSVADGGWYHWFSGTFIADMNTAWKSVFGAVAFTFAQGLLFFSAGTLAYGKRTPKAYGSILLLFGIIALFAELHYVRLHELSMHTDTLFSFVPVVAGILLLASEEHETGLVTAGRHLRRASTLLFLIHPLFMSLLRFTFGMGTGLHQFIGVIICFLCFYPAFVFLERRKPFRWLRFLY